VAMDTSRISQKGDTPTCNPRLRLWVRSTGAGVVHNAQASQASHLGQLRCLVLFRHLRIHLSQCLHTHAFAACSLCSTCIAHDLKLCYTFVLRQGSTCLVLLNIHSGVHCRSCSLHSHLVGIAAGLVGAVHASPSHTSSRVSSTTVHLQLYADFSSVGLKEERISRFGETARAPSAMPKLPTPLAALQSHVELEVAAVWFRADAVATVARNLRAYASSAICNRRTAPNCPQTLATNYTKCNT
jgi:hypothetical protein